MTFFEEDDWKESHKWLRRIFKAGNGALGGNFGLVKPLGATVNLQEMALIATVSSKDKQGNRLQKAVRETRKVAKAELGKTVGFVAGTVSVEDGNLVFELANGTLSGNALKKSFKVIGRGKPGGCNMAYLLRAKVRKEGVEEADDAPEPEVAAQDALLIADLVGSLGDIPEEEIETLVRDQEDTWATTQELGRAIRAALRAEEPDDPLDVWVPSPSLEAGIDVGPLETARQHLDAALYRLATQSVTALTDPAARAGLVRLRAQLTTDQLSRGRFNTLVENCGHVPEAFTDLGTLRTLLYDLDRHIVGLSKRFGPGGPVQKVLDSELGDTVGSGVDFGALTAALADVKEAIASSVKDIRSLEGV